MKRPPQGPQRHQPRQRGQRTFQQQHVGGAHGAVRPQRHHQPGQLAQVAQQRHGLRHALHQQCGQQFVEVAHHRARAQQHHQQQAEGQAGGGARHGRAEDLRQRCGGQTRCPGQRQGHHQPQQQRPAHQPLQVGRRGVGAELGHIALRDAAQSHTTDQVVDLQKSQPGHQRAVLRRWHHAHQQHQDPDARQRAAAPPQHEVQERAPGCSQPVVLRSVAHVPPAEAPSCSSCTGSGVPGSTRGCTRPATMAAAP